MAAPPHSGSRSGGGGAPPSFDLPDPVLAVLPSDPFEQLDVARKITSIALSSRVSKLESDSDSLRQSLADKDDLIADLRSQLETLDASLADVSAQLARAAEEKESLVNENAVLSNTVKKLNRDVSKLEVFKKTLLQSLQEEGSPQIGAPKAAKEITNTANFSTGSLLGEEAATLPPSISSSARTQFSDSGSSTSEHGSYGEIEASRQGVSRSFPSASYGSTPRLTPPDSPPRRSAGVSPTRLSKPVSPRRQSISFSSTRNMLEDRPSLYSSLPPSHSTSMTSAFDTGAQTGRTRVDGKEFFRQVRSRLSYEQFSVFLANVKELNAHKQTREETLRRADQIFGPDNKDLFSIFEGLITRNLH